MLIKQNIYVIINLCNTAKELNFVNPNFVGLSDRSACYLSCG